VKKVDAVTEMQITVVTDSQMVIPSQRNRWKLHHRERNGHSFRETDGCPDIDK
jgi:hypothetical protein